MSSVQTHRGLKRNQRVSKVSAICFSHLALSSSETKSMSRTTPSQGSLDLSEEQHLTILTETTTLNPKQVLFSFKRSASSWMVLNCFLAIAFRQKSKTILLNSPDGLMNPTFPSPSTMRTGVTSAASFIFPHPVMR